MAIQEGSHKIPRQLTPREKKWIENFKAHETPASLRLATDYIDSLRPGDKVLDVGCGFGRVSIFLANTRNVTVMGVDINASEIKYAKENSSNPIVDFAVMDGTQLEFPDNSFNSVIMLGVLGGVDVEVRRNLLIEAYRVVKPGGTVAVAEFKMNLDDPKKVKKYEEDERETGERGSKIIRKGLKILFIAKHFTEDELTKLFSDAGFISMQSREQAIETAGIGDGMVEVRQQHTVWGTKPVL